MITALPIARLLRNSAQRGPTPLTFEKAVTAAEAAWLAGKITLTDAGASRILMLLGGRVLPRPYLVLQGLAFMTKDNS